MRPDRGQSGVIGVVLLLAITILGTGVIVGLGTQAFADTERTATVLQAKHSLTQFDSKAAIVALGESPSQRVNLGGSGGGNFVVDNESGWIRVVHQNATGSNERETIYNESMGAVSYQTGDVEIAYQGGGVWERRGNNSVMRSPPEFNYRGATLTLPSIQVNSTDEASGQTTAIITRAKPSRQVFPNASAADVDEAWGDEGAPYGDNTTYANPVTSGNVTVTVQSRFYQGWAEFFRTRTSGEVSVDHERNRVSVELITTGTVGAFSLGNALSDDGITARGQQAGHSLTEFNTTFVTEGTGNDFNNHYAGFYAESGGHRFEYVIHVPSGSPSTLELNLFYRNTNTGEQHEWSADNIPIDTGPIRLEDTGDEVKLIVNLTAGNETDGVNLIYGDADPTGTSYNWTGTPPEETTFSGHGDDGEPITFNSSTSDEATTYLLTRHYFAFFGDEFTIYAKSGTGGPGRGGGAHVDPDASRGVLDYESGGGSTYITYLHVTENGINVELA